MKNLFSQLEKTCKVFIVSLLGLSFVGCNKKAAEKTADAKFELTDSMMNRIGIDTVKMHSINGILNLNGKVQADENRLVEVFPIVGGNVMAVNVELGDYVQKGQTLAVIRSGEIAEMQRQLVDAQTDVQLAENNVKVQQDLFGSKLATERDLVISKKELEKAKAGLDRIKQMFNIYQTNNLSEYLVKAPISGFVIYKNINRDMTLPPDRNNNIFTIAELSEVWVLADVYESEISKIKEGLTGDISTLSYPGVLFTSKIDKVYNVLDPTTKTMKVRFRIANANFKLKTEMLAMVSVQYNEGGEMISIPTDALVFDDNKMFVMVFNAKNDIETREVAVYKTTGSITWINSGLKEGEKVISKNQLFIYDALND